MSVVTAHMVGMELPTNVTPIDSRRPTQVGCVWCGQRLHRRTFEEAMLHVAMDGAPARCLSVTAPSSAGSTPVLRALPSLRG